jgi:hypothetical protein
VVGYEEIAMGARALATIIGVVVLHSLAGPAAAAELKVPVIKAEGMDPGDPRPGRRARRA